MRRLDSIVQLSVASASDPNPPGTPTNGQRHIVPVGGTGDWAGQEGQLAVYEENAWVFITPRKGFLAFVEDIAKPYVFDGANWIALTADTNLQNLPMVGVNASADSTNRLTVSAPATLFNNEGNGHQIKVNKAASGDTASLLFQTNWSGRAEMGTTGSDDFEIKVSDDGSTFHQSLVADAASGKISFPSGVTGLTAPELTGGLITTDFATARGDDLITNGGCGLGNAYNFPVQLAFDAQTSPDLRGSVCFTGYHVGPIMMDELIPVDPNRAYRMSSYLRQESQAGDWSGFANDERHQQYLGLTCLDADQNVIESKHHMRYYHGGTDSLTTLAAPLQPGDTTISLTDATGWNESTSDSNQRGAIIFGYKDAAGRNHDHYSRIVEPDLFDLGQVDKVTHIVTLNAPLPASMGNPDDPSGIWPTGTKIANSSIGNDKNLLLQGDYAPAADSWYEAAAHIGGIDTSGTNAEFNFAPGTSYVQVFWQANYSNRSGGFSGHPDTGAGHKAWFAGLSLKPVPLAAMSASANGSVDLKVPESDFGTGSISLVSTTRTIEAL
ncbi:DUF2793 domain-containing protein [Aliiroseovarius sp. KMU-50]|uniref:DUF2793 domain-containing protein n=1 Tax=Aliiroseovarius salicola TaxID=3009082 RepID=A0ABT4VX49_9RHOB|nr:DUF2793 domain-containing protein [Aliiroseovarius sp. KMU-50]MDA5092816.1 DUF2793 domain-containing protein [Aliiroseovarius sp. KMU-50]